MYRIIAGNEENHFSIDANGTLTRGPVPLDRETKTFYQLTVEAYNAGDSQPRNTGKKLGEISLLSQTMEEDSQKPMWISAM